MVLSIKAASWDLDKAPTFFASTLPFLKIINVGMPLTLYFGAVTGLASTSSLTILSLPAYSSASSSSTGAIILQGPHHCAQKSTRTGPADFSTSSSKLASVTCDMFWLINFPSSVRLLTGLAGYCVLDFTANRAYLLQR